MQPETIVPAGLIARLLSRSKPKCFFLIAYVVPDTSSRRRIARELSY